MRIFWIVRRGLGGWSLEGCIWWFGWCCFCILRGFVRWRLRIDRLVGSSRLFGKIVRLVYLWLTFFFLFLFLVVDNGGIFEGLGHGLVDLVFARSKCLRRNSIALWLPLCGLSMWVLGRILYGVGLRFRLNIWGLCLKLFMILFLFDFVLLRFPIIHLVFLGNLVF